MSQQRRTTWSRIVPWAACAAIAVAAGTVYCGVVRYPFVFDDVNDIVEYLARRSVWPPWQAVVTGSDQGHLAFHNRPLAVITFALNAAMSGAETSSYHLTNIVLHMAAGMVLFGLLRGTLRLPALRRWEPWATPLAFAAALIWTVHPLNTQAVTYIVQRYESLMGLFYLLTMYGLLRSGLSRRPAWWSGMAVLCCLLGLGCKEVACTAPLVALLYDRAFLAGSFAGAWKRRKWTYLGFAGCLVTFLVYQTFTPVKRNEEAQRCLERAIAVNPRNWIAPANLGAAFADMGDYQRARPLLESVVQMAPRVFGPRCNLGFVLARCGDWGGAVEQYSAAFELRPDDTQVRRKLAEAHVKLANIIRREDPARAVAAYQRAIVVEPNCEEAHNNLGALLSRSQPAAACKHLQQALALNPQNADAHNNLANLLCRQGNVPRAIEHYQQALRIRPDFAGARANLATARQMLQEEPAN